VAVPYWLQIAAAIGDAVGGIATAAAVGVAGYEIFWRRRSDRHDERRGDAAAGALVTLARQSRALIGKCLLLQETIRHGHVEGADALPVATSGAEFFAKVEDWLFVDLPDEMYEARLKTTALLSEEETAALDDLGELANLLLNELSGRVGRLRTITDPKEITPLLAAMNASLEEWVSKVGAIELRGRAVLGPIAQLRMKHG